MAVKGKKAEKPVASDAGTEDRGAAAPASQPSKRSQQRKNKHPKGRAKLTGQRGKNGRSPHATRPTQAELLKILERQDLVYELVKGGNSFRKISAHLKSKGYRASLYTVHSDLVAYMDRAENKRQLSAEQLLKIELDHLDEIRSTFYLEMKQKKDPEAAGVLLRVSRERDRYLGISKAQQSDIAAKTALAALLGMDPEELPDGDGHSK